MTNEELEAKTAAIRARWPARNTLGYHLAHLRLLRSLVSHAGIPSEENCPAVKFLQDKIMRSLDGEDEIVLADERQFTHVILELFLQGIDKPEK